MASAAQRSTSVTSDALPGGVLVFTLTGEFDFSRSHDLEGRMRDAFEREPKSLIVDLRGVSFLDSTMLELLIRALARAGRRGIRFVLIRPNSLVWRVFVITRLSEHFQSYRSLHEALASC